MHRIFKIPLHKHKYIQRNYTKNEAKSHISLEQWSNIRVFYINRAKASNRKKSIFLLEWETTPLIYDEH